MKYLTVLLIATACSAKIETTTPGRAQVKEFTQTLKTDGTSLATYSTNMESTFALLWPIEFDTDARRELSTALKIARRLQVDRRSYTSVSTQLKKAMRQHQCECILMGMCEGEIEPAQQEESLRVCSKLEAEQLKNDEQLSSIVTLQEKLKTSVLKMGGYWLDVTAAPTYDFSTGLIDFKDAEFFNDDGKPFGFKSADAFWKLDSVKIDGALQVQGELKVKLADRIYRGELGFQLPERGN